MPGQTQQANAAGVADQSAAPKKNKVALAVAGVVTTALVATGVVLGVNYFRAAPSTAEGLPATVDIAFQVEINPSDAKKVDIYNFLTKFPSIKDKLGAKDDFTANPLRKIWDSKISEIDNETYENEVKPWLGDSISFGAVADGKNTPDHWIMSINTKDTKKAKEYFDKELTKEGSKSRLNGKKCVATIVGNSIAITPEDDSKLAEDAKSNPLSKSSNYSQDIAHLSDKGIATFWMNENAYKAGSKGSNLLGDSEARIAASLVVKSDSVEIQAYSTGKDTLVPEGNVQEIVSDLPDSTNLIFAFSFDDASLKTLATKLKKAAGPSSEQTAKANGLDIERDLPTLLGSQTAVVAEIGGSASNSRNPGSFALVSKSNDTAGQEKIWKPILAGLNSPTAPTFQTSGNRSSIATSSEYAQKTLGSSNKLRDNADFKSALDFSKPVILMGYLRPGDLLNSIPKSYTRDLPVSDLKAISSVGISVSKVDDHSVAMSMKLTAKG